jgi:MFS family permease
MRVTEFVETTATGIAPATAAGARSTAVDGRGSRAVAGLALGLLSVSYGSPLLLIVGLKPITEDLGTIRQVTALATAVTWIGTGAGGILMGWIADRIGIRRTVIFGAAMIALGLAISATGSIWALFIGHFLFLGLLGNGAMFPPLMVYVSRWFKESRGAALALISSGQYIAGMVWPTLIEQGTGRLAGDVLAAGPSSSTPIAAMFLQRAGDAGISTMPVAKSACGYPCSP